MIDFQKMGGLVPAVIQNAETKTVLMVGFMNDDAYRATQKSGKVTFFSRTKNRLWTKGETSGNFLNVVSIAVDCDNDSLLIQVLPAGNVCHTGRENCFGTDDSKGFLYKLENLISHRIENGDENSYVRKLSEKGINKIAQKVGEEAVEVVIEAKDDNLDLFQNEAADLLFHFLILLKAKNTKLEEIERILVNRNK
ncbi:bifunctional phosphoribosyl-AMP cyclohydrolase/phosphoribosyl-ATP diphosphatase HisIE [Flavobacterium sp.]|uniref:bifunctional phosphoribosyl-AMP cyclohydrolase/phosphoribosyl-ATP diphosphatase HisIE n=1 Tax=Flavobacterium sp. TaxID=239 RepID=UPI00120DB6C2|nr:bifunctional phosphoribosyl-AMP cyclohydrolase/phosphoribosyl-ATP diphosphatase HisIE [Flavobacterium sp.]RZJ69517.1 MAG: bifunctional phosphoribosyl-AMP cyclohydrolase/phosphoribosyl-ATP diphosphatase HisIE [Flavobacterium sp.]